MAGREYQVRREELEEPDVFDIVTVAAQPGMTSQELESVIQKSRTREEFYYHAAEMLRAKYERKRGTAEFTRGPEIIQPSFPRTWQPETVTEQLSEFLFRGGFEYMLAKPFWELQRKKVPTYEEWVTGYPKVVGGPVGPGLAEIVTTPVFLAEATIGEFEEYVLGKPTARSRLATLEQLALSYGIITGAVVGGYVVGKVGPKVWEFLKVKVKPIVEKPYEAILKKVSPERYFWRRQQQYFIPLLEETDEPFKILVKTKRGWTRQPLKTLNELVRGTGKKAGWQPFRKVGKPVTPFKTTLARAYWTPPKQLVSGRMISLVKQIPELSKPVSKAVTLKTVTKLVAPTVIVTTKPLIQRQTVKPPFLVRYTGPRFPSIYEMRKPWAKRKLKPYPELLPKIKPYPKTERKLAELSKQAPTLDSTTRQAQRVAQKTGQPQLLRLRQAQKQETVKPQRLLLKFPKARRRKPFLTTPGRWYFKRHPLPTGREIAELTLGKPRKKRKRRKLKLLAKPVRF